MAESPTRRVGGGGDSAARFQSADREDGGPVVQKKGNISTRHAPSKASGAQAPMRDRRWGRFWRPGPRRGRSWRTERATSYLRRQIEWGQYRHLAGFGGARAAPWHDGCPRNCRASADYARADELGRRQGGQLQYFAAPRRRGQVSKARGGLRRWAARTGYAGGILGYRLPAGRLGRLYTAHASTLGSRLHVCATAPGQGGRRLQRGAANRGK